MPTIYGIDTDKPVTPRDVTDAMVACFIQAHKKELDGLEEFGGDLSDTELDRMKELNVQQLIRNNFDEVGGDFENPTKESLTKVLDNLKDFAQNFRDQETVNKHARQIEELIKKL